MTYIKSTLPQNCRKQTRDFPLFSDEVHNKDSILLDYGLVGSNFLTEICISIHKENGVITLVHKEVEKANAEKWRDIEKYAMSLHIK